MGKYEELLVRDKMSSAFCVSGRDDWLNPWISCFHVWCSCTHEDWLSLLCAWLLKTAVWLCTHNYCVCCGATNSELITVKGKARKSQQISTKYVQSWWHWLGLRSGCQWPQRPGSPVGGQKLKHLVSWVCAGPHSDGFPPGRKRGASKWRCWWVIGQPCWSFSLHSITAASSGCLWSVWVVERLRLNSGMVGWRTGTVMHWCS